ncbi:HD domain-containing protein [Clostridium cylindrosporum]|uniref:GTP pyrophosphokinase n=1 Tax=Clostridium cylindrosporum DSM 605 TaxID=1121307 RepID=A0A0J8DC67_CLOCY|nr:HD domain-containing protein [Clostridium cylindrosporum]KMT21853.1 GTP pyrophosphokinase [Clostridium cylindrosporum DSM 605]
MLGKEEMLYEAINIASTKHRGQKDKGGSPYILHPLAVMNSVRTIDEKIVAILHDIIEDTDVTKEDLYAIFDKDIVEAVDTISKKKGQRYEEYIELIKNNKLARKVKIADYKHNLDISRLNRECTDEDLKRVNKYVKYMIYLNSDHKEDFDVVCPRCASRNNYSIEGNQELHVKCSRCEYITEIEE